MRILTFVLVLGLLAACSADRGDGPTMRVGIGGTELDSSGRVAASAPAARHAAGIAAMPDRGQLLEYRRAAGGLVRGAYTWHPVDLSEEHALRGVASGELRLRAPDGHVIRLRYDRHIEHADGNWTWIGREPGSLPGTEAVITFGEKAVFGSIPNRMKPPLRLMMADGRTWLVETDPTAVARLHGSHVRPHSPDFLVPPRLASGQARASTAVAGMPAAAAQASQSTAVAANTIDLVLGYTNAFATRYGGQSGAVTRLTHLVDIANVAFANSLVDAQLRLVRTQQVSYPDATSNQQALYDLTGVECTEQSSGLECEFVGVPAALQPLHVVRDQYGADLVSLVRNFNDPENGGCGIAWLNGAGQVGISPSDEVTGLSVVSDSGGSRYPDGNFVCREESLVHELGHNMGSAHDRDTADGDDNVLQANEYGRFPYSFGYKSGVGNFFTVMAYGDAGQVGYRVFSNPAINYCGGNACGVPNAADNARSLRQTIPTIVQFRQGISRKSSDFNGDGRSDILWRNVDSGFNTIWLSANSATGLAVAGVGGQAWRIVGTGDYDGDGGSDIFWRNVVTGANVIWKRGDSGNRLAVKTLYGSVWQVATGDFNGDGRSDILWRNASTGFNTIWLGGDSSKGQQVSGVGVSWVIAGTGDYDGDGRSDVLWRNPSSGANVVWKGANAGSTLAVKLLYGHVWQAHAGDFNGDGRTDILWRNGETGFNTIWLSGNSSTGQAMSGVGGAWRIVGAGDYDGDNRSDVLWRDPATGSNVIWRNADANQRQAVTRLFGASWQVAN